MSTKLDYTQVIKAVYDETNNALKITGGGGGGSGTVTSVDITVPSILSVSGNPITTSGTLAVTLVNESANTVFAGPTSGGAATPTFRSIVSADVPTLNQNTTGTASNITASSNSTLTTLSVLSLPGSQVTGTVPTATNFSGSLSGDVSGTQSATSVNKINGVSLAGLATGILKNTTGTGAPSIAIAADFPILNQNTTGTATNITASSNSTLTTLSALSLPGSQVTGNISGNSANVTGTVAIVNGGTGQTTANTAFNALSPMTTLGDITYEDATPKAVRLAGNTTATKQFLTQTGNGTISAAPSWGVLVSGDIPNNAANTTGTASNITASSNTTLTSLGTSTSTFTLTGGLILTTRTITANLTIDTTTTDYFILCNQSGAITITLPTPVNGRVLVIKDISGTANTNNITLARHASEKIEGLAASKLLQTNFGSWTFTTDGTDWWMV